MREMQGEFAAKRRNRQESFATETQRPQSERNEIPGGNADRCENKGVARMGIQKMLKTKE